MKIYFNEFFAPWRRLERIERELNRAERVGCAQMLEEYHRSMAAEAMRRFHDPSIFIKHIGSE